MVIPERERLNILITDYFNAYFKNKFDSIYKIVEAIKKEILSVEEEIINQYIFYLEALVANKTFIKCFTGTNADVDDKLNQLKAELPFKTIESVERLLFLCPEQTILALEQFSVKDLCHLSALPVNNYPLDFTYFIRYTKGKKDIYFLYDRSVKIDYCEYVGKIMPMNNEQYDGLYDYHIPIFKLIEQSVDFNIILTNKYENIGNHKYFYVHTVSHISEFLKKNSNWLDKTIPTHILNDINIGKAFFILNSAQEGVPIAPYYYIIQKFLKEYIKPEFQQHYIVLSANTFEQKTIYLFNRKKFIPSFKIFNSVLNYFYSNFHRVKINLFSFRYFEYCISLQYKRHYAAYSYDKKLTFLKHNHFKTFLCFNGHEKDFRYAICFLFWKSNLLENGAVSLRKIDSISQLTLPHNKSIIHKILIKDLSLFDKFLNQLPFIADKKNVNLNYWYQVDMELINTTFLWVITETTFSDNYLNFSFSYLTEKTYKPIAFFMPFVMVGDRYALKRLKEDGYLTFDKWWSEEYDSITDAVERLHAIVKIVDYLNKKSSEEKLKMYIEMKEVLLHNHSVLTDKSKLSFFENTITDEN